MGTRTGRRLIGAMIVVGSFALLRTGDGRSFNTEVVETFFLLAGLLMALWSG